MNTLSEFCTPAAAEEVYSMLVENRYSDFEVIDGRIYLQDGQILRVLQWAGYTVQDTSAALCRICP